jgi:methylenetetrahydrofolate dehydrogenase (NADP+)/methenyltetrahydrofolate cyclohydrolase/formyltetrahydrofolate synthetase
MTASHGSLVLVPVRHRPPNCGSSLISEWILSLHKEAHMIVDVKSPTPSDIEIAQAAKLRPIREVAADVGLTEDDLDYYGKYKAKVHLDVLERFKDRPNAKYIDVTAITPTPLGEGKTTTTCGLSEALYYLGKKVFTCIRQPSQGPTFGIKGGAAGGGYSQIVPMEDFNLHLTGDIHAVSAAHNLLAAAVDARIMHEDSMSDERLAKALCPGDKFAPWMYARLNKLGIKADKPSDLSPEDRRRFFRLDIDPYSIMLNRVVDISDRAIRNIVIGLGTKGDGRPRQSGYDISVASEVMAILMMASDMHDLRARLGRMVIGTDSSRNPVTAEDLGVAGAMTVLMKDALMPNLMQTLSGGPAFVHAGPFANIAPGNSSIIADKLAVKLASGGYVVTESGFGADIGMEKFFDIKCRASGLIPNCVVIVATVRALKMHGGGPKVVAGIPLAAAYKEENIPLLEKGAANLVANIKIARKFGIPVVVAVNRFSADTDKEIEVVRQAAKAAGAEDAIGCEHWAKGELGAVKLAEAVLAACEKPSDFKFLYPLDISIKDKIETIAKEVYGADGATFEPTAQAKIKLYTELGYDKLPMCMAKTHLSLSHDAAWKGVPKGYMLPVRDIRASVGAGFLYPLCGTMRTMPGLPSRPVFMDIDLDLETGKVTGLS